MSHKANDIIADDVMDELCGHGQHPGFCMDCARGVDTHKVELDRCLRGIESVLSILTDLMDEEKRRGPAYNATQGVHGLPEDEAARGCLPDDPKPDQGQAHEGLGMREMS
jgi:Na+-translocating ferredoxin:NAD+ oxidoreductase RNF subunit RnfB